MISAGGLTSISPDIFITRFPSPIQAAVKNSPEVIETLLDLGAPIDYMDEYKHTAILRASEYGHIEVVRLLCRRGCDTNV